MVHLRLNERESNPNPHINFITPLPAEDQEDSRQFLRALAAQVRPVMKAHGFVVNSLEEYEHNPVFAGRNWNNGETVELVLRRPNGSFLPTYWLMSTFCHELAHIKHMNHGPAFQALWKQLRNEVRSLQDKGYYGDGYWSSGTRLADGAQVSTQGIEDGDFPEYMCGGAQSRARPTAQRRRRTGSRRPRETVASNHDDRQSAKRRKAGARVTSKYAFAGEGAVLNEDGPDVGKGKGKQAKSKRAREERAMAAERRMRMLQAQSNPSSSTSGPADDKGSASEDDSSDEEIIFLETDADRRKTLLASETNDLEQLKNTSWTDFENDFVFTGKGGTDVIDISSDEENNCDLPVASGSTFTTAPGDRQGSRADNSEQSSRKQPETSMGALGVGKLVQTEIDLRKKESLGMAPVVKGGSRTLGRPSRLTSKPKALDVPPPEEPTAQAGSPNDSEWECLVCTLHNESDHLACSACATPRGQETWTEARR